MIYFFIILSCFIFGLLLYKEIYSHKNFTLEKKSSDNLYTKPKSRLMSKEFDILIRLKFIGEYMFELNEKNSNIMHIKFNYDYPRYFTTFNITSLEVIANLLKFLSNEFNKTLFIVEFSIDKESEISTTYKIKVLAKNVFLESHKSDLIKSFFQTNTSIDDEFLINAKNLASEIRSPIEYKNKNRELSFSFVVNFNNLLKTPSVDRFFDYSKKEILLSHLNDIVFNDISNILKEQNCNITPSSDWDTLKRHLQNPMFFADIAFIDASIIGNSKENVILINDIANEKHTQFVIILNNKNDSFLINQMLNKTIFIKMPYTYEEIYATFELCKNIRNSTSLSELQYH